MLWTADIHASVSPEARLRVLHQALRDRVIPPAFHYENPRQARKWLELHEAFSPARRHTEGAVIYQKASEALAACLRDGEVVIVGLGCGGGQKDRLLAQACLARGMTVHYAPVDISLPLVLTAARTMAPLIQAGRGRIFPLVCDLTAEEDWRAWWQAKVSRPASFVFAFYGLLPTLSPVEVQRCLARWLGPESWLLMSANLVSAAADSAGLQQLLSQYDNHLTRQWLGLFLEDLGVPKAAGEVSFAVERYPGSPPVWAIVADWQGRQPVAVAAGDQRFRLESAERLRLFTSYRYTPGQVPELLMPLGPKVAQSWINHAVGEGVFLCAGAK